MSYTSPHWGRGRHLRALSAAFVVSGLMVGLGVYAAAPPAGTSITNQATASYKDSTGAQQLSTSNTVVTTVTQVGSFALTPNGASANSKSAAAGATVYMAYTLTNTGNGSDTFSINASELTGGADFSKIEVYLDSGAGLPANTTPLCTSSTAGTACTFDKAVAGGEAYKFVVAYTIPATATPSTWGSGSNTATVTVATKATGALLTTYGSNTSKTGSDTVNLTTGAAFAVGKAIMAPAVSSNSSVSATWPVKTSGPRGTTSTYTLSYANNGATSANLYIKDSLPAGFSYVANSAVISCAGGTGLTSTAADAADAALCNGQGIDFAQSGQNLEIVIPSVPASSNGTLSFQVLVSNTAAMGTTQTSNTATYTSTGCSGSTVSACTASTGLSSTNAADFTVTASRGVVFNTVDTTVNSGTPATGEGVGSFVIVPGSFVRQVHTIQNTGNTADTFNLTTAASTYPSGSTFKWFVSSDNTASGNLTPLLDSDGDGTIDTGEIASGVTKTVILQISVPSTTPVGTQNYSVTVTASSSSDLGIKDATFAKVVKVIGGLVDLQNTGATNIDGEVGIGPGQTPVVTTSTILAGSAYSQIQLNVVNNNDVAGIYNLQYNSNSSFPSDSTVQGSLPAGWAVTFSSSTCPTATASAGSSLPSISGITVTPSVPAGNSTTVYACVSSPVTAVTTTQPVYFKVTSTTPAADGTIPADAIYDAVSVVATNSQRMSLAANGSGSVAKGLNVDYGHTLTNSGTQTCGAGANGSTTGNHLKVVAALSNSALQTAGWTVAVYADNDNNGIVSSGDTIITDGILPIPASSQGATSTSLAAGKSAKFIVRVYAPGGANAGDTAQVNVTVSDVNSAGTVQSWPDGCGTQTNTDTTTVVTGSLSVVKQQDTTTGTCSSTFPTGTLSAATRSVAPGDCIYYQITATNNGASPVTNVSLSDAIPAYTTQSAQTATCSSSGLTPAVSSSVLANSVLTCTSTSNTLAPAGSVTLQFSVQVNN